MSIGTMTGFVLGILGPAALLAACVWEYLARRMARDARHDKVKVEKLRHCADVGLVAAWLLLAASYLSFSNLAPDAAQWEGLFQSWMTGVLAALLVLDIVYLFLRRARPRPAGKKKNFWEL